MTQTINCPRKRVNFNTPLPRFAWGVVLPECDASRALCPELPRDYVIDMADLAHLPTRLAEVFEARERQTRGLSRSECDRFLRCVAPEFDLAPSLAYRIRNDEQQLIRLTDEQFQVLDILGEERRVGVRGGAGTGKTLVAMERARRLTSSGDDVLMLCFNKPLADHLQTLAEGFVVRTFHEHCRQLAEQAGLGWPVPGRGPEQKPFWEETTAELLSDALEILDGAQVDHIVIDEGQDFRELWWMPIQAALMDTDRSSLWVFFDPNQDLYGGGPIESLGLTSANLSTNCRNSRQIAEHVAGIIGQSAKAADTAPEGQPVTVVDCASDAAMQKALRQTLHQLINEEGLTTDQVVILSPFSPEKSRLFQQQRFGNYELVAFPGQPQNHQVVFSTLHKFKGLEADAIVLAEVREEAPYCGATHRYVAASRARHHLTVLRYTNE